jgi:hypothetical protein
MNNAFDLIKQSGGSALAPSYDLVIINNVEANIELAKKVKKDKKIKRKPQFIMMLKDEDENTKYKKYITKEIIKNVVLIPLKITNLKNVIDNTLSI